MPTSNASDRHGSAILRFDRIERIGVDEGRNSKVWRAYDRQRGERIALKEIGIDAFAGDPSAYFAEAQAICAAANARVVPLLWAGKSEEAVLLAMPEYSHSLASKIRALPMHMNEAIAVAKDVCDGVAAVHRGGRLHLDLKPSNVLFDSTGRAAVADFGQALSLDDLGIAAGKPKLYASYWPPEYFNHGDLTVLSDVYQVGLTLYSALNGDAWYCDQLDAVDPSLWDSAIADGTLPDREAFLPHVPRSLRRAVCQALEVDPEKRFESVTAFSEALSKIALPRLWLVTRADDTGFSWRLSNEPRAALEVEANLVDHHGRWEVEVWTCDAGGARRRRGASGEDALWASRLTWAQLQRHLNRVFRRLS